MSKRMCGEVVFRHVGVIREEGLQGIHARCITEFFYANIDKYVVDFFSRSHHLLRNYLFTR
uniref:Uncharacterized protein n=1 Tax=Lepeophtheirus salmonis TaxID=72036 RepID=A0A0K2U6G0_LEPSM